MSRRVRWLKSLAILVVAIVAAGLIATLMIRAFPTPHRAGRERAAAGERVREQREFRGPELRRGAPAVLKQIVIVGVMALLGRTVLRIRL